MFSMFLRTDHPSTYVNMHRGSDNRPLPKSFAETEIKEVLDHIEDSSSEDDDESGIDREIIADIHSPPKNDKVTTNMNKSRTRKSKNLNRKLKSL